MCSPLGASCPIATRFRGTIQKRCFPIVFSGLMNDKKCQWSGGNWHPKLVVQLKLVVGLSQLTRTVRLFYMRLPRVGPRVDRLCVSWELKDTPPQHKALSFGPLSLNNMLRPFWGGRLHPRNLTWYQNGHISNWVTFSKAHHFGYCIHFSFL